MSVARVLAIAPEPFFAPRGTPFSVYYRLLAMCEQGLTVDLLTYGEGWDVDIAGLRVIRIPQPAKLHPVRVGPSAAKAVLDVVLFVWTVGLLVRHRYGVVHAHEESVFFCLPLKPLFRFKLIYDMHSSLPEQLTNFGFTRSRILIGLFKLLEAASLRAADAVITISPALADYARSRMPDPGRHFMIENSVVATVRLKTRPAPDASVGVEPAAAVVEPAAVGTELVPAGALPPDLSPAVVYAGTFERYQGLDLLLEAFAKVLPKVPEARLVMIGGSADNVASYRQLARQLGVAENCTMTGIVQPAEARRLIRSAQVLVSPRTRGTNTPLKIYEQLWSGVPLVATRILAHTQVVSDDVCVLVEPTASGLADGILRVLLDPGAAARTAGRARELYQAKYGWGPFTRSTLRVLAAVGAGPPASDSAS